MRKATYLSLLAALNLLLGAGPHAGAIELPDDAGGAEERSSFRGIVPKQEEAVQKGLSWLQRNQEKDGSWGSEGRSGQYRMAMTGLAGLAFLSAGHTPGRGEFAQTVSKAVEFCLKHQNRDGLLTTPDDGQSMYGHGFAMTFLAEAYGMEPLAEHKVAIRDCLTNAVKLTARAQSSFGGWYYSPNSGNDEGSVTITQVQALRACANVGIPLPPRLMENALSYMHKAQTPEGGIRYSARFGGAPSPALSAAGAELLMMAGQYEAPETKKVIAYVKRNLNGSATIQGHYFYTHFYGAQAMMQIGGSDWERYYEDLRKALLSRQGGDGSWRSEIGPVYCTAIGTMILALPYEYLPIFQK